MTRRTRSFADLSDADVFALRRRRPRADPGGERRRAAHRALAQLNLSDLAFVRERARAIGAELWVDDRTLHASPRSGRGATTVTLAYGSDLREFTVLADLAEQPTSVTVTGWDVGGKAGIAETADAAALGAELGSDESGADILGRSLGGAEGDASRRRSRLPPTRRGRAPRRSTGAGRAASSAAAASPRETRACGSA